MITTQRSYLDRLENELSEGLQLLSEELGRDFARNLATQQAAALPDGAPGVDLLPQIDELNRQIAAYLAELEPGPRRARASAGRSGPAGPRTARSRSVDCARSQGQQEQRRAELNSLREQLADAQSQSVAAQERQEKLRRELAAESEKASAAIEETKAQRRKLARDLKAQHAERSAEFEQRKAELKALETARNTQLERQLADSREETEQARSALQELKSTLDQRTQELASSAGASTAWTPRQRRYAPRSIRRRPCEPAMPKK